MDIVKNPNGSFVVTVEVEGEQWKKAKKHAFNQYKNNLKVKGFRQGQVPMSMAKKMIPDSMVVSKAAESNKLINDVLAAIRESEELKGAVLIAQPAVSITELNNDKVVYQFTLQTEPEAVIGNYKELGIEKASAEVTDEEVDQAVQDILGRNADWVLVEDGESKKGDRVTLSMNEADSEEEPEEMTLIIGDNRVFPVFEEELIGFKPQETKTVTVTYPENYMAADLAGQEKSYVVTMKEIFTKDIPELNDESVAELELPGISTVEELKENRRNVILDYKTRQSEAEYENKLIAEVAKTAEVELPNAMIDAEVQNIIGSYANQMSNSGFSLVDFLEASGMTMEQLKETARSQAIDNLRARLAMEAVARDAGIAVTDEELDALAASYAQAYGAPIEEAVKVVNSKVNVDQMLMRKAVDYLKSVQ